MSKAIIITTLVENSVYTCGLLAEHSLAFHLQAGMPSRRFHAGRNALRLGNAVKLGLSLVETEAIR